MTDDHDPDACLYSAGCTGCAPDVEPQLTREELAALEASGADYPGLRA